jgi:hypothetical protein
MTRLPIFPNDGTDYLERCTGDPARLMKFARNGCLSKDVLASLLRSERRSAYLDACSVIEKQITERCTAKTEHCLEGGCAMDGDICLDALLKDGPNYFKACAAEWLLLFEHPENRIDAWRA